MKIYVKNDEYINLKNKAFIVFLKIIIMSFCLTVYDLDINVR